MLGTRLERIGNECFVEQDPKGLEQSTRVFVDTIHFLNPANEGNIGHPILLKVSCLEIAQSNVILFTTKPIQVLAYCNSKIRCYTPMNALSLPKNNLRWVFLCELTLAQHTKFQLTSVSFSNSNSTSNFPRYSRNIPPLPHLLLEKYRNLLAITCSSHSTFRQHNMEVCSRIL